jgi:hypothetical protein
VIEEIFKTVHPNEENVCDMKFHIPFIPNILGQSPMHKSKSKSDIRTINTMVQYLAGYGIDHHSRTIIDLMPYIISKQLPAFCDYLDSRLQQTIQLREKLKGNVVEGSKEVSDLPVWFNDEDLNSKLVNCSSKTL